MYSVSKLGPFVNISQPFLKLGSRSSDVDSLFLSQSIKKDSSMSPELFQKVLLLFVLLILSW